MKSIRINILGSVQGVGFRPFVYRLAHECSLNGWVQNTSQGVDLELEGAWDQLELFLCRITKEVPPHCVITHLTHVAIPIKSSKSFEILPSKSMGEQTAVVLPDIATCPQCLKEVFDQSDHRYLYPFTNCTHCGPRYSIIEALPYDRTNTSMKHFSMCLTCQREYDDPLNRRFHAQPNACPNCGPWVELQDDQGKMIANHQQAMEKTAALLKQGAIVAVKGLGGFHLMVDACNEEKVRILRNRKNRPHKPLAVMFPSIEAVESNCVVTPLERALLVSFQAPIVLLRKKEGASLALSVAPANPYVGALLPCMPLQHILLSLFNGPLIATSGNISDEPICIDNQEAFTRLFGIADYFLVHNRPIVRQVDDSFLQEVANQPYFLRRSRGFAPVPVTIKGSSGGTLAVGAHQKNTVALSLEQGAVISQHIGDLDTSESINVFKRTINSLRQIYSSPLKRVVCDMHPEYNSSRYAGELEIPTVLVQHHYAHVASCMAEHGIEDSLLGVCWDGTGYGQDNTIWGGEFIKFDGNNFSRVGHLRLFPLPGGEVAVREPRRSALGLLYMLSDGNLEPFADLDCIKSFSKNELEIVTRMMSQKINSPMTSSMGRFFDGVSSLIGLCHNTTFEGQAAMALEFESGKNVLQESYSYDIISHLNESNNLVVDWQNIVLAIIEDIRNSVKTSIIAAKFHRTLVKIIVDVAQRIGERQVVLTGGCFQNKLLVESAILSLGEKNFVPVWHQRVPTNDGGIALGQIWIASRR
ncbi:MAG: carbamoyltransferase HypF [Candidatus Omnitrophota bacterium]